MAAPKKRHHLEGIFHFGKLDGKKVITTWTTKRSDANRQAEKFRAEGADFSRVFTDGRIGFRIVGYW